ncbi:hypothetical protein [Pseudobutyrivibrio sp.]|uniref:hypothetical protein n=1 Tax=Pseudobutyrivibrio sp. TaxID=2014367 RepID=UPI00386503CE
MELLNFLFGSKSRTLGNSYGPQTIEEILRYHLLKDSVALSIIIAIGLIFVYQNDKYQFQKKQQQKKSPIKDPILDKIIEGALSGKTTDDILKTQNDDSEIEKEVDDDNKEYQ